MAGSPVAGFLIEIDGKYMGMDGLPTDLQNARSFAEFEDALQFADDQHICEYVTTGGKRELAYAD